MKKINEDSFKIYKMEEIQTNPDGDENYFKDSEDFDDFLDDDDSDIMNYEINDIDYDEVDHQDYTNEDKYGPKDEYDDQDNDELDKKQFKHSEDYQAGENEDDIDDVDNNFQGSIRNVPGAMLVYKRQAEDSTYEELWIYNVGRDIKYETKLRRAILNGTDISPQTGYSGDRKQTSKIYSIGNVQYLNIFGLPN